MCLVCYSHRRACLLGGQTTNRIFNYAGDIPNGWTKLIIYTFDDTANIWTPLVFWDSGAKDVRMIYDAQSGEIEVQSADGKVMFIANIEALKAGASFLD